MTTYVVNTWFSDSWKTKADRLDYFLTKEEAWVFLMEISKESPAKVQVEEGA